MLTVTLHVGMFTAKNNAVWDFAKNDIFDNNSINT